MSDDQRIPAEKWAAMDPETRAQVAEALAGSEERHRRTTQAIAELLPSHEREALPGILEDIAQDPARYDVAELNGAARRDLMRQAGYLLEGQDSPGGVDQTND